MSQITGTIQIASSDPSSPRVMNWRANKRYGNEEQSCPLGYEGTAIPANTVYADTQVEADAAAEAMLSCVPSVFAGNIVGTVYAVGVMSDDSVVAGGNISVSGSETIYNLTKLDSGGSVVASFAPSISSGSVYGLDIDHADRVVFGGTFTTLAGASSVRLGRVNSSGVVDALFTPQANERVNAVKILSDGKILIGGLFTQVNGIARGYIARLNSDGSLDESWNAGITGGEVLCIAESSSGDLYVGGRFTQVGGVSRSRLARIRADGSLDTAFVDPLIGINTATTNISTIVEQSTGRIIVGGAFTQSGGYNGTNYVTRMNANGSLDLTYNLPQPNAQINALLLGPSDSVVVGGGQTLLHSTTRNCVGRLLADGSLDASFLDPAQGIPATVYAMAYQSTGKIIVAGSFTALAGATRNNIGRLNSDGTLA